MEVGGFFVEAEAIRSGSGCHGHCEDEVGDSSSRRTWDAESAEAETALGDEGGVGR